MEVRRFLFYRVAGLIRKYNGCAILQQGNWMHEKEIISIISTFGYFKWIVGVIVSLVAVSTTVTGIVLKVMFGMIRDARAERNEKLKNIMDTFSRDILSLAERVGTMDDITRQNENCIVGLKHDLAAVIRICEDRHGRKL